MNILNQKNKIRLNILSYLCLILSLVVVIGCGEPEDEFPKDTTPAYIVKGNLFDCNSSSVVQPDIDFQVNHFYEFAGHYFFGGFEDFIIANKDNLELVFRNEFRVNKFVEYNSKLILCLEQEGIYEIDEDLNLEQKSTARCLDVMVTSKNELLVVSRDNDFLSNRIYELDRDLGLIQYSETLPLEACIGILKINETSNGDIWAGTCSHDLVRVRNKEYLDHFDESNSPLFGDLWQDNFFLLPYDEGLIFVNKNPGQYQILKFKNDEWISLLEIKGTPYSSDQDAQMSLPSIVDANVFNDELYVGTTLASCRGFHKFDISKDELLKPEDYFVVEDPQFINQCIDAFEILPNGNVHVVVNGQLTTFDCN